MTDLIQVRRGTSAEWAAANPVLAVAEPGFDTTTGTLKLGDGATPWAALPATGGVNGLQSAFDTRYVPIAGGVWLSDAAQTITTSTVTDITWGTEIYDPDGWVSGGGGTLTVPTGKTGRYVVSYTGTWSANPTAIMFGVHNGTAYFSSPAADAVVFISTLTFVRTLTAGDTLIIRAFQTSGSNKDVTSFLEIAPV